MQQHTITTVDSTVDGDVTSSTRECSCGWVTIATTPEPAHHTPLAQREADHLTEAAAIEDGSIWRQVPARHEYQLHLRRRLRDQTPNEVVITAIWWGGSQEVLIWDWNADGLAAAQAWCDQHPTTWAPRAGSHGFPVTPNSLAVHANAI